MKQKEKLQPHSGWTDYEEEFGTEEDVFDELGLKRLEK